MRSWTSWRIDGSILGSTGLYWTLRDPTGLYRALLDPIGFYWTYQTLRDPTELYGTLLDGTLLDGTKLDSFRTLFGLGRLPRLGPALNGLDDLFKTFPLLGQPVFDRHRLGILDPTFDNAEFLELFEPL